MRRAWAFALAAPIVLFLAPDAAAHANLESSSPAPGTTVRTAPDVVTLELTEEPELALSSVEVLSRTGARVHRGGLERDRDDDRSVRAELSPLQRGVYTVSWRVVSRVDGHATAGSFAFGVGVEVTGAETPVEGRAASPSLVEVAGRWLLIVGSALTLGGALVALFVLSRRDPAVAEVVLIASVLALAGVLFLAVAQQQTADAGWGDLLRTSVGRALVWRGGAALVAVAGAAAAVWPGVAGRVRGGGSRAGSWLALLGAATVMGAEVSAGHAAGASAPSAQIAAQWAHFLAAGAWLGGLAALLVALQRVRRDEAAAAVGRYSAVAAVGLAVVAFTGTFRAVSQIGGWGPLLSSGYGRVVLAKAALFLLLAGLGARQRFVNRPRAADQPGPLRRTGFLELTVAVVVFAATALLTALSPPSPSDANTAGPLVADGTDLARTTRAELTVSPSGYAGPNRFTVRLSDPETGDAVDAERVTLDFELASDGGVGPSTLGLRETERGRWEATGTNLSIDGRWTVTVIAQGAATGAEIPLEIATRCRTQATPVTDGPTIYDQQLDGGRAQTYADPGRAGTNEVHFTFFDDAGEELEVPDTPEITAWRPGRTLRPDDVQRFSPGHFVASVRLDAGRWRFDATARPGEEREPVRACFEETIDR